MTGALLRAEGLSVAYGRAAPALDGVSFEVSGGQAVGVLGPNGGGKTTLFRALLGELAPSAGQVDVPPVIAYVPQTERTRLDFPVNALDVALMGRYGQVPWYRRLGAEQRRRAMEALARVGLAERAGHPFGELSGGQRQRALIARALTQDAEALLLDEPLTGVDGTSASRILALLDELRGEGRAVLLATHDLAHLSRFDAVLCLNTRQVAFGPPSEALTPDVLRATYGQEVVLLDDGTQALAMHHRPPS